MKTQRPKPHYAWFICAGCALLLFCTSGLAINAFSIYQPYIISSGGFTNTQSSAVIACRNCASLVSMLLAHRYYGRLGMRRGMTLSGILMVSAFVIYGVSEGFYGYCAAAVLTGIAYGTGTMIPIAILIGRWFDEKKDTAMGICSAVTGISTLGIPSLIDGGIKTLGLSVTFLIEAAFIALAVLVCFLLLRDSPEEMNTLPYGAENERKVTEVRTDGAEKGNTAVRGGNILIAAMLPVLLLIGAVMNVSYSHLTVLITGEGLGSETAALAMSVSGLTLMGGKLLYGRLGDRLGNARSNFIFAPLFIIGIVLLGFIGKLPSLLYPAMALYSFGMAYMSVGLSTWPSVISSGAARERVIQIFQTGYAAGSLLFSPLPGIMADSASGSYIPSFRLFALFSAIVFAAVQTVLIIAGRGNNRE